MSGAPPSRAQRVGKAKKAGEMLEIAEGEWGGYEGESRLEDLETVIDHHLQQEFVVGRALRHIHDHCLWPVQDGSFNTYVYRRFSMCRSWAYRLIQAANIYDALLPTGDVSLVKSEGQVRPLGRFLSDPARLCAIWTKAVRRAIAGQITARFLEQIIREDLLPSTQMLCTEESAAALVPRGSLQERVVLEGVWEPGAWPYTLHCRGKGKTCVPSGWRLAHFPTSGRLIDVETEPIASPTEVETETEELVFSWLLFFGAEEAGARLKAKLPPEYIQRLVAALADDGIPGAAGAEEKPHGA